VLFPSPLKRGVPVRVVAPSGPFDRTLCLRGIGFLGERYRVRFDWSLFTHAGYLAGSDLRRQHELEHALSEADTAAVIAARGGYGITRILPALDLGPLLEHPRWIVGFSDVTALHVECARLGIASVHAHNCCGLGRGDATGRDDWREALEDPKRERRHSGLEIWKPGRAEGVLFGGNLTVLFTLSAMQRLFVPDGAILFLEDITESAYRIDRMLTALRFAGAFDRVAGVVLGGLTDCPPTRGIQPDFAAKECLLSLGVPVLAGLGAGHGRRNHPLVFGTRARIEDDTFSFRGD
jgi:muramoyltetrapeptide carboxypeptidase